ncbi:MAG: glycosyltransferase [Planctomycetota bacterium]|nr:glycosyltransferase [Planctomycetota bacterium]
MKVVLVNSLYSPHFVGGAERSVQALAEGLVAEGHQAVVVSTADQLESSEAEVNGVAVHYLPYKNRYWTYADGQANALVKAAWHARDSYNRAMAEEVSEVVRRERPDVAHTNNLVGMSVAVWDALHRLGVPIVHTLRDYYLICPKSTMYSRGTSCDRPCLGCVPFASPRKSTSRHVSAVVGVSQFILDKHLRLRYFPQANQTLAIRTGYDPTPGTTPRRDQNSSRPLSIGFLGLLSPNKGIEELLEAVGRLPPDRVELHVGGTGQAAYEAELRRRFDRPNVRFHGQAPAAEFLRSLDILVVASRWEEPLARVIIEALSCGTPVVTTPRGGSPEVVIDGRNGLVCNGDDAEAIRHALDRLVSDPSLLATIRRGAVACPATDGLRGMVGRYVDVYERTRSTDRGRANSAGFVAVC